MCTIKVHVTLIHIVSIPMADLGQTLTRLEYLINVTHVYCACTILQNSSTSTFQVQTREDPYLMHI